MKTSEIDLFTNVLMSARKQMPNHTIMLEGGGAAPLCISIDVQHPDHSLGNDGKMVMWFGTANDLWMADCLINSETAEHFDFDTNTFVSSDCEDADLIALGIAKVVARFEHQPIGKPVDPNLKWKLANARNQLEMMPRMLQAARDFVEAARVLNEAWEYDSEAIGTAHASEAFTGSFDENLHSYYDWLHALEEEIPEVTKRMKQILGEA